MNLYWAFILGVYTKCRLFYTSMPPYGSYSCERVKLSIWYYVFKLKFCFAKLVLVSSFMNSDQVFLNYAFSECAEPQLQLEVFVHFDLLSHRYPSD